MQELIFGRDYNTMTSEESAQWARTKEEEIIDKNRPNSIIRLNKYAEYPKAARHNMSLFPNNFLDSIDISINESEFRHVITEFQELLDSSEPIGEREILSFINSRKSYFKIGAILQKCFLFGHHACFIFPEFQLGTEFKVDYLLTGANSHGYH